MVMKQLTNLLFQNMHHALKNVTRNFSKKSKHRFNPSSCNFSSFIILNKGSLHISDSLNSCHQSRFFTLTACNSVLRSYSRIEKWSNFYGINKSFLNQTLKENSCIFASKTTLSSNYFYKCFFATNIRDYSSKRNVENIHSHITSLKTKRRIQRKKRNIDEYSEEEFQTVAYATADEYHLEQLSVGFSKKGLYIETPIVQATLEEDSFSTMSPLPSKLSNPEDVLHLHAAYHVTPEPRTMYVFREGVIVLWNVPSLECQNILKFLQNYQSGKYSEDIVEEEAETLTYTYTDSATRLKPSQNLILLNENGEKDLEKFTFSNALAMSVKLGIWEASLDRYVESIEYVTEELRNSGVVVLSQEQVLQRMGQLFALRHLINLSSDLLDTPDFYWEHEVLGQLYNRTANYLNIKKRTSVMNTKLNHCLELMELLKSHLNERHSARLEWIIIILIMIEIFFELLHFI